MTKLQLLYGFLAGLAASFTGTYLFIVLATDYSFTEGITLMKAKGFLGKLITLGAILNILLFFALLYFKRDLMARGVVLATILLTIITLLV